MSYQLRLVTAPATEPLSLAQAKTQVRVEADETAHDDDLSTLIVEARQYVEQALGRQLLTATWDLAIDRFPVGESELPLPLPPLQSVTSLQYYDTDGTLQTWDDENYHVSTDGSENGRLVLAPGASWPTAQLRAEAVRIRFVAGYGDAADDVPAPLRRAIKLLVGHWFTFREEAIAGTIIAQIPTGVERILTMFQPGDEFTCFGPAS
ncbi:MAG TPA: hypothetical protein DCQ98_09465 [Planctomycetaceae bacterium]|nr:hypothetical protein [Planctomycetaceae bacterium]